MMTTKTKYEDWTIFQCTNCCSPPFGYHSEKRNVYLVDSVYLKNPTKIVEEQYSHQKQPKLDTTNEFVTQKRFKRTRTKKKRRRKKRKKINKNKIKIKSTTEWDLKNGSYEVVHPFLEIYHSPNRSLKLNKIERNEFDNVSNNFIDPFPLLTKQEEEEEEEEEKEEEKEEEEEEDEKYINKNSRFSQIFEKVSQYEKNHSFHYNDDSDFQMSSDDQQEKLQIFQQESKSVPIPIFNSLTTDLQSTNSSMENRGKSKEKIFIQPHKYIQSLQTPTERSLENAFNVPLKRVPSWRISNNVLNIFSNPNLEK
ncbi:yth domain-containing protein 1 isoform x1 [Anaeramoeba flamelloides]|uniref:Yth domain-containing protein 1 isoform x1 n=1 Tax=Anaeramoeba flamelloides TaxID=1746091 RepID=A0ABQ8XA06_9EUKA|nr:yth domain-containing protein 1 isoform x1 [Anaeramoeba flamelloides]